MKTITLKRVIITCMAFIFIFFMARWAYSENIVLAWNPNTEPNLAGYYIFQAKRIYHPTYKASDTWKLIGTNKSIEGVISHEFTAVCENVKHHVWYVTAFSSEGSESRPSNIVELYAPPPANPINLRTVEGL